MGLAANQLLRSQLGRGAGKSRGIAEVKWFFNKQHVKDRVSEDNRRALGYWGGDVQRAARRSIKRKGASRPKPKRQYVSGTRTWTKAYARWRKELKERPASPPGKPPYTHTNLLRQSILFSFEPTRESVVVGPSRGIIGEIGALHEHGGERFGATYPARPFMGPAMEKSKKNVPKHWSAVIAN